LLLFLQDTVLFHFLLLLDVRHFRDRYLLLPLLLELEVFFLPLVGLSFSLSIPLVLQSFLKLFFVLILLADVILNVIQVTLLDYRLVLHSSRQALRWPVDADGVLAGNHYLLF